ncbi:hypothetical protein LXA43DRAFT_342129 [Ganoderma leucocontextum]|nr:hypothetical protein LXA43DRAFT_342129 [Ganoderma leucocontextum]
MQKCLELSCLPKPSSGTKSIKFKRTTPGSISSLVYPNRPPNPNRVLDPTHPALHFKPPQYAKAFPWRSYPGFSLRALPKSLLDKPSYPAPNPPFILAPPRSVTLDKGKAREEDTSDESEGGGVEDGGGENGIGEGPSTRWNEEKDRISMSLANVASLGVGGRVVRVKVDNKVKNAIALVATRGADVECGADGVKRIIFRDEQAGPGWVLRGACFSPSLPLLSPTFCSLLLYRRSLVLIVCPNAPLLTSHIHFCRRPADWTYICRPDPRLNLVPYTELIPAVRRALKDIYVPGQRLEDEWSAPAALQVARLLDSLGPLGGSVTARKPSHKIDGRKAEVGKLLDELAKHGVGEPDRCEIPSGHTLLEAMLKRYRDLVGMRTELTTEAGQSAPSGPSTPAPTASRHQPSSGSPRSGHATTIQQPRSPNATKALPGREMIKARPVRHVATRSSGVDGQNPRSLGDR